MQDQVREKFDEEVKNLDQDNPFYFLMYESLRNKLEEHLEAIELFSKRNKKRKFQQKSPIDTIENKIKSCADIRKNKILSNLTSTNYLLSSLYLLNLRLLSSAPLDLCLVNC